MISVQNWRTAGFVLLFGAISTAAADAVREALDETARCAAVAEAAERLRCYDAATARAKEALAPRPEDFGRPAPKPEELTQLSANVREFRRTARGLTLFVLDNGQTWRQLEADGSQILEPPPGTTLKVTIERGLLDSYNLTIEGRNGLIKVRRVE